MVDVLYNYTQCLHLYCVVWFCTVVMHGCYILCIMIVWYTLDKRFNIIQDLLHSPIYTDYNYNYYIPVDYIYVGIMHTHTYTHIVIANDTCHAL